MDERTVSSFCIIVNNYCSLVIILIIQNTTQGLYYSNSSHVIKTICADSEASNPGRIVFAWYQLMVMFILPVAMMAYGYSFVISVLWASTKQLSRMTLNTWWVGLSDLENGNIVSFSHDFFVPVRKLSNISSF